LSTLGSTAARYEEIELGLFAGAAHDLLSRGLAVLPVGGETGKQPLVAWAKQTKPSATAFVDKLILRYPDTNVGIICHLSRVTVADIAQAALIHVEDNAPNAAAEAIRITDADRSGRSRGLREASPSGDRDRRRR
jgi:hypothetical protein